MTGNVSEWVWDRYGPYGDVEEFNPIGPLRGSGQVARGGSWKDQMIGVQVRQRRALDPAETYDNVGFRLVRTVERE